MSTKCTIKYAEDEFHLYSDVIDELDARDDCEEAPVYLELRGVEFEAYSHGKVLVTIPADTARKLGLLPTVGKDGDAK